MFYYVSVKANDNIGERNRMCKQAGDCKNFESIGSFIEFIWDMSNKTNYDILWFVTKVSCPKHSKSEINDSTNSGCGQ